MDGKEAYVAAGRAVKWEIRQRLKAELPRMNAGASTIGLFSSHGSKRAGKFLAGKSALWYDKLGR
jgi:hypothetical protein